MPWSCSKEQREYDKFVECDGETAVRVVVCEPTGGGDSGPWSSLSYGEVTSLVAGSPVIVDSYTVTAGRVITKSKVFVSGCSIAIFELLLNGSVIAKQRTSWTNFNTTFDLRDITFNEGDVISVRVEHNRPSPANFNATILGIEL